MSTPHKVLLVVVATVVLLVFGAAVVLLLYPPTWRVETLGGPVAIVKGGAPQHGFLGVEFERTGENEPPIIRLAIPGTGAAQAGLQPGDVLQSIDGQKIANDQDFRGFLATKRPGSIVSVEVIRGIQLVNLQVELMDFANMVILSERHRASSTRP